MWGPTRNLVQSFSPFLRNLVTKLPTHAPGSISRSFHCIVGSSSLRSTSLISSLTNKQNAGILQLTSPLLQIFCGFKVKGVLKRRCKDCYHVVRKGRGYIICKTHPRHKQMAMAQRPEKKWILTHATQSKIRPY
ncbi:39S ribosomal protein L36, mitochondrial [Pseudolycoriella hygida]|uniref:Ribosomal protein n=1 Tax=Pseudolycoriella hygida TaxID=35572 RepID=A0A9Q0S2Y9_9DIPT|nr:39S ribosomal protein L36, mitochondrial [Pseudolycoriella hygida]